jgi:PPOX class probable F420-dependent enzyme
VTLPAAQARARFAASRVARLATVGGSAGPRLVPVCFAMGGDGDVIWTAVDHKPKSTLDLARLRDIARDPRVTLLADHYDDADWSALWWTRATGTAVVLDAAPAAVAALAERYAQYRETPPAGPVIEVTVTRWSGWAADAPQPQRP